MDFAAKVFGALFAGAYAIGLLSANQAAAQGIPTTIATYTYNAKGERITKTLDGATTYYNYDEHDHLVSEHGPNGSRDYIYLGDMLVSTVDTPAARTTMLGIWRCQSY
jgi:YD repeat-containing protein